jgi:tRNA U54 and U55 pseudouridine synthase Pus10
MNNNIDDTLEKELESLLNTTPKKMSSEELETFLVGLDASDPVKEVFRKYFSDEVYAENFNNRVAARAAQLIENYNIAKQQ